LDSKTDPIIYSTASYAGMYGRKELWLIKKLKFPRVIYLLQ
jgi:hypothetical protein